MPTAEHLHLALNHFPILGMPVAALVVVWGLVRKSPETRRAGLVLLIICAAFTPVIMSTGESAHDAYDGADFVDSAGYAWMTTHGERAETAAVAAYAAGALALVSLVAGYTRKSFSAKLAGGVAFAAIVAAFATAGLSVWVADAGGKIRRPDFREPEVPSLSKTQTQ